MTYLGILILGGLLAALLTSGVIYRNTTRRSVTRLGSPVSNPLLLAATFGVVNFSGFLVPYVYQDQLAYTYLQVVKPTPVLVSPYEWTAVSLAIGTLISTISGSLYFVGVRYAPFETE